MTDLVLDITDQQTFLAVDHDRLRTAIARVLTAERIDSAEISLALVDDSEIHRVNREFLGHDYPTDVISFLLNDEVDSSDESSCAELPLEGELIVSTETALREAAAHGWSPSCKQTCAAIKHTASCKDRGAVLTAPSSSNTHPSRRDRKSTRLNSSHG